MAVAATHLTAVASTTDATSFTTSSYTPSANKLILASVSNVKAVVPDVPTFSGNGLTWVQVDTRLSTTGRITVFRAMGASPSAGAATADFGGATQTGCIISIEEFDGVDTGGSNGSAAVVQSANNAGALGTETSLTVTLAAFGSADNATFGAFHKVRNATFAPGTGFTELDDRGHGTPGNSQAVEWRVDNDTSVDCSWAAGTACSGIAIEIKAAAVVFVRSGLVVVTNEAAQRASRW